MLTPSFGKLFAVAALCAFTVPSSSFAQSINLQHPERSVSLVKQAVGLTPDQEARAMVVLKKATADLLALPEADRLAKGVEIRTKMRADIRALLTPEQRHIYDRTPQPKGGGLMAKSPESRMAELDKLVSLSVTQKTLALEIFEHELDMLFSLPEADRPVKGAAMRKATIDDIRLLLTPEQRQKYDAAPQAQGNSGAKAMR